MGAATAGALLAIAPLPAFAQNTLPSREELTPAERTAVPGRAAPTGVVGQLDAGPCPFETSELSFTLQAVEFGGLTALPAERLARAWAYARGRDIPVSEICRIRDRAAQILLDEGFLARVEIPPQQISGGRVRLEVVEARIATVRVRGTAGPAQRQVERYMERLEGLAPFDLNVVQRQILLASDIPGIRLATNVRPSDAGQGAVELEVEVSRDAVDALAAVQNLGSRAAGRWSVLGRVDLNSFTGLGERTSLVVSSTTDFEEQRVIQLLEEVRIGGSGLIARGSVSYAESRPGGAIQALDVDGESVVASLEAAYPIIRHRRRNLWLSGGIELVDQETDVFGGVARLIDDELRVLSLRLDGNQRSELFGVPAFGAMSIEIRQGIGGLGGSQSGDTNLSRTSANPKASVLRADARSELAVTSQLSVAGAALFQWADDPLLAYEEQAIGNYTIGRGYDPGAVAGDRALASAFELRYGGTHGSLFGFFDIAWVENLDPGIGSGEHIVKSVGGGLRLNLSQRVNLDLTYAHPIDPPVPGGPDASDRLLVNLVTRFW